MWKTEQKMQTSSSNLINVFYKENLLTTKQKKGVGIQTTCS